MKALLYGHFANIFLGIIIFSTSHWILNYSTEVAVILTITSTLVVSVLVSILGTRKLSQPINAMHHELHELHEKVNQSNSALTTVSQTSQALLEDLPLGFLVFNKKIELTKANQRAYSLLGFQDVNPPNTVQVLEILKTVRGNGDATNFVDWLHQSKTRRIQEVHRWSMAILKNGDQLSACDVLVHYNNHDSNDYELVVLLIDRTDEYEHQEKQMEFISLAAHELRGPITVMRGLINILEDETVDQLSDEHKNLITRMAVSSRQLAGYVDNILNVSRIDRDGFAVNASEASWQNIISQATNDLGIRARAHKRKLEVNIPKNLPTVAVDQSIIMHVINNLVDNAIKYSPENGTVKISATTKENTVETTIQDFGIGIPANVVDNLFTKFYRSHKSKQLVSGTGLGLYLCKAIIEAHGGNIWVRSSEGVGTTFGFTIPTYESVAAQLKSGNNEEGIVRGSHGWIKNHALYRR